MCPRFAHSAWYRPARRCLLVGHKEPKGVKERAGTLALPRPQASLDLGEVHASRGERVALGQPLPEIRRDQGCISQVPDEDRRVEDVDGQDASSVRR